jgi:hypothetical protein
MKIVRHDIDEPFPKMKERAYTYTPTEKQMANLKRASEQRSIKAEARRKEKAEIKATVEKMLDLKQKGILPNGEVKPAIVSNEVNSSVQQIDLTVLDSLKKEIAEVRREKSALEDLVAEIKDQIIENKKDMKTGQAQKIRYPQQAGNHTFVAGYKWA